MDKKIKTDNLTRRGFLKNIALGTGATVLFSNYCLLHWQNDENGILKAIIVDYDKCTGCKTCETACSASNHKVNLNGQMMDGLGNPWLANIRVHHFNPDADIPNVCHMCPDAPCIAACPVEPHPETGRRAIYRDGTNRTIKNDPERCIGCGSCALACKEQRAGVIIPNPETGNPERMCTLCDGDPQCVKKCPYGALSLVTVDTKRTFYGKSPKDIAGELMNRFYKMEAKEVSHG